MEIWKPVTGYEGLYEVSNLGRVRSLFRYKKVLHPSITNGYLTVELWKDHKRKRIGVHRLVAQCFCDNPCNKPFVNHKDETRWNNNADNLEWVTHIENCNYGTAIQRRVEHTDFSNRHIDHDKRIRACARPIMQFSNDGSFIREWISASECSRENGWQISNIRRSVKTGGKAYGYFFKERGDDNCRCASV